VEIVIRETAEKTPSQTIADPILKCLVEMEETVQQLTQLEEVNGNMAMNQADSLIQLASDIVETLTGEKVED
jgi:hypothetical protein